MAITNEERLHIACAQYLDVRLRGKAMWWHTANERQTNVRRGAKLKRMGVRAGLPDIFILKPISAAGADQGDDPVTIGRLYAVELKSLEGRLSPVQRTRIQELGANGCPTVVVRELKTLIEALDQWGL